MRYTPGTYQIEEVDVEAEHWTLVGFKWSGRSKRASLAPISDVDMETYEYRDHLYLRIS